MVIVVYASCRHLYRLCKTHFRRLTKPYRVGFVTHRVTTKCLSSSIVMSPHFTDFHGATEVRDQKSEIGDWIPNSFAPSANSALNHNFIPGRYPGIQYLSCQMLIVSCWGSVTAVIDNSIPCFSHRYFPHFILPITYDVSTIDRRLQVL